MENAVMSYRLDKYLALAGIGTRSEVKAFLKKGMVTVDGQLEKKPERKISGEEIIHFQGREICYEEFRYLMLHKPAGVVTATRDQKEQTVMDLITLPGKKDLFPVGRLDKDTEGLLLITNDGELAHRLLSPKKHVDKCYFARVEGPITEEHIQRFAKGLDIGDDTPTLPARLRILSSGEISEVEVTIQEGRYHQIKRMFEAVGSSVCYLKRLSMGSLVLDENLEKGGFRRLTGQEIAALKKGNREETDNREVCG